MMMITHICNKVSVIQTGYTLKNQRVKAGCVLMLQ